MPIQLLLQDERGRLVDRSTTAGDVFQVPRLGRGLALGDLDNDGLQDVLLLALDSPLTYLHNVSPRAGHWLQFALEGAGKNRDAIGARVTVTLQGRSWTSWRVGGGSYASASDPRLSFGLGDAHGPASIEIAWPSGKIEHHTGLEIDAMYRVSEGMKTPQRWDIQQGSLSASRVYRTR